MIKSQLDTSKCCTPNNTVKGLTCSKNIALGSLVNTLHLYCSQHRNIINTPNIIRVTCTCEASVHWFSPCPRLPLPCGRREWLVRSRGDKAGQGKTTGGSSHAEVRRSSCWALTSSANWQRERHAQPNAIRKRATGHLKTIGDPVPGVFSPSPKPGVRDQFSSLSSLKRKGEVAEH